MRIGTRRETVDKNIIVFRKPVDEVRLGKSLFRLDITRMELYTYTRIHVLSSFLYFVKSYD